MGRSRYALGRLAAVIPMLVGVSLLLFAIMSILPGGPEGMFVAETMDAATIASVRRNLGLDQPAPIRYVRWATAAARGDLGRSFRDGQPVLDQIVARLPATVQLTAAAMILALAVAIPSGIVSATRRDSWLDLLEKARRAPTLPERKRFYGEFQRIVADDAPYCFLYHQQRWYAFGKEYRGFDYLGVSVGVIQSLRKAWPSK